MSLLIDADFIVYKCCAANESEIDWGDDVITVTSKFSEAYQMVERELYKIANDLGCFDDSILFFSDSINFRKSIDPTYKGHRNRKKPCGYRRVINFYDFTAKRPILWTASSSPKADNGARVQVTAD
jgi:DNA polymerase-1